MKPCIYINILLILMLSGCALPIKKTIPVQNDAVDTNLHGLALCQSELQALQGYDPARHSLHKKTFDAAQENAAQYLVVRPTLSLDVQALMDSIYQTQMARQCQQIHADLFSAMITRADSQ